MPTRRRPESVLAAGLCVSGIVHSNMLIWLDVPALSLLRDHMSEREFPTVLTPTAVPKRPAVKPLRRSTHVQSFYRVALQRPAGHGAGGWWIDHFSPKEAPNAIVR